MIVSLIINCDFITCLCFLTQDFCCYVSFIDEMNLSSNHISFLVLLHINYTKLEVLISFQIQTL